jgi:hypothetical protein
MRTTIWKFPLKVTGYQVVQMPLEYKILSVGVCPNKGVCLWAEVNAHNFENTNVEVVLIGTGHGLADEVVPNFVGTVIQNPYVWHVYVSQVESK